MNDRSSVRPPAIQFLTGAGLFSAIVFLPNYAAHVLGASDFQVGLIIFAGAMAAFWASYIFGRWADVRGRRGILQLGLILAALASLTQIVATDPTTLALSRVLVGITFGMYPAALLAYAHETRRPMGRFVAVGALGWGVGSVLAGFVATLPGNEALGLRLVFALSAGLFALAFLLALRMPFPAHVPQRVPLFPAEVIRRNLPLYAAVLIRHTGANMIWVIFPLYLEDGLGITKPLIGVLYLVNTFSQFAVMLVVDRFPSKPLIAAGLGVASVAFLAFTLAQDFWQMLPIQVLLGFSWASLYVGGIRYVITRTAERATSVGLLGSAINLAGAMGPLLGGIAAVALGRLGVMYIASGLALTALLLFAATARGSRGEAEPGSALARDVGATETKG